MWGCCYCWGWGVAGKGGEVEDGEGDEEGDEECDVEESYASGDHERANGYG